MQTRIVGLFAAGEAVGGANGANRLSGNAITEAFVFGQRAGLRAAESVKAIASKWDDDVARNSIQRFDNLANGHLRGTIAPVTSQAELQKLMWANVGPFRTGDKLESALKRIQQMQQEMSGLRVGSVGRFNLDLHDWFELRAMLTTAEAVVTSALARTESRGAHQREDFPAPDDSLLKNQVLRLENGKLATTWIDPVRLKENSSRHD
jgi:succinate dehydrogenase / fumarate reductase flavoprotein subunit